MRRKNMRSKSYLHTKLDEGPDNTLYARRAMTTANTVGWDRQSWSTAKSSWRLTNSSMGYIGVLFLCFCCLAVYFGTCWLCMQLLPPWWVVEWIVNTHGQFRSLVLHMDLVYPCSHSGVGECKAAGLMELALACFAAEPLCCAPFMHTHTCMAQHNGAA